MHDIHPDQLLAERNLRSDRPSGQARRKPCRREVGSWVGLGQFTLLSGWTLKNNQISLCRMWGTLCGGYWCFFEGCGQEEEVFLGLSIHWTQELMSGQHNSVCYRAGEV